jgi:hypothetical protein
MDIKRDYPEFAAIEAHIRRAHAERSVVIAGLIASATFSVIRGFKTLGEVMGRGLAAERDRRAIEADTFVKRWVPKY